MKKSRITFRAIPLTNNPRYEVYINKSRRVIFNPLLSEFEFPYKGNKQYSILELQQLSNSEINDLVFLHYELTSLIKFCTSLPLLHFGKQNVCIPPQHAKVVIQLNNSNKTKPKGSKSNVAADIPKNAEINLKAAIPKKLQYVNPTDLCFTKVEKKPYTPPEVRINYDSDLGKNEFYIFFSYLENGVFKSFKIALDKINKLTDLETRRQKAAQMCVQINRKLYKGWHPERIKVSGRLYLNLPRVLSH